MRLSWLGALLVVPSLASCVQFNAECSPPVDQPDFVITWLAAPVPIDKTVVRTHESALGDAITDAFLAALKGSGLHPQVAIDNAGDMRDLGLCVTRTELGKGALKRKVLKQVIAFSDELVTVRISQLDLFNILEHGVATVGVPGVNPGGQFLQVSGLSYEVDCSKPAEVLSSGGQRTSSGQRVRSITLGGETITRAEASDSASVIVALSSFLAGGGDNFIDLAGKASAKAIPERYTYNVVEDYLHGLGASEASPAKVAVDPQNPRIVLENCE